MNPIFLRYYATCEKVVDLMRKKLLLLLTGRKKKAENDTLMLGDRQYLDKLSYFSLFLTSKKCCSLVILDRNLSF